MPIRISEELRRAGDGGGLEDLLWTDSAGVCAICRAAMDPEREDLEAGRRPDGSGLHLSHARCHHDVVDARDVARIAEDPAEHIAARGWTTSRKRTVAPRTPLLRVGSEQRWRWLLKGTLADGTAVQAGCVELAFDAEGGCNEEGVFLDEGSPLTWTVLVLDAAYPAIGFLTMTRHAWELDLVASDVDRQRVELESAEFRNAIRLVAEVGGDELAVRARFTPAVQLALIARGIPEAVRYEADVGTILVGREGSSTADDLAELVDLLGDAVWLRAVLAGDPPGRVPDREELRALVLGGVPPSGG